MKNILFLLVIISLCLSASAQPARKAIAGLIAKPVENGMRIDSIIPNSSFAAMPVKKGDVLTTINNVSIKTTEQYNKAVTGLRAGDVLQINYISNGKQKWAKTKAVMRPYETSAIADIQYDWVAFRGGYLRAITRKPKGKTNCPAILLIPGYGCGSIENYAASYNGKLLYEWVKAGYAVITVEKSGLGDSYDCVPCAEADLVNEIESFDAGYRYMENLSFVDKKNLFIWGHSMGGVVAPEVAKRHQPKGVLVFACTFRPWSEFLLEMHRVQKPLLENFTYQQTEDFIRGIQKIYYEFFVLKKSPEQLYNIPEYKELAVSDLNYAKGSNNMWGRHWRYWMQLDSLNMAETWKQVNAPVLVLHGAADYEQCSVLEPLLIKETVNAAQPGTATWITIDDIDHIMMKSKDWKEAAANFKTQQYNKGNFNYKIAEETIRWLKQQQ
ncbi:MAG: alpha/beta fold hydrolase [Sphingobacteriales bacterium]|nr:MAG: alpha/beta fold hydrolase [Sphingobacteriales bacterium]